MPDFNRNHFELFGLPPAFALDRAALERAYRDIQSEIHPDRFAHAGEAEQRLAMQWTARVNEAYQTLRQPFERARYLLELHGVHALDDKHTAMPADFLLKQIEWREQLQQAKADRDFTFLQRLESETLAEAERLERQLQALLDERRDYAAAAETLRKYRFIDKLLSDIGEAMTELDIP